MMGDTTILRKGYKTMLQAKQAEIFWFVKFWWYIDSGPLSQRSAHAEVNSMRKLKLTLTLTLTDTGGICPES